MFSLDSNYIILGFLAVIAVALVWWIFRKDDEILNSYNQPVESDDDWDDPIVTIDEVEAKAKQVYINSGYRVIALRSYLNDEIPYDSYVMLEGEGVFEKSINLLKKWENIKPKSTNTTEKIISVKSGTSALASVDPYTTGIIAQMASQNDFVDSEVVGAETVYTGNGNGGEFAGGGADGKWDSVDSSISETIIQQDESNNIGIHDTFKQLEAIHGDTPVLFGGVGDFHNDYTPISYSSYTGHSHDFGSSDSWSSSSDTSSSND